MREFAVEIEREAGDVVASADIAAGVEDIDEIAMDGDAEWLAAARALPVDDGEAGGADGENGDVVAARIDGEEEAVVVAEGEGAGVAEAEVWLAAAGAETAGEKCAGGREGTVFRTIEDQDGVAGGLVGGDLDPAEVGEGVDGGRGGGYFRGR